METIIAKQDRGIIDARVQNTTEIIDDTRAIEPSVTAEEITIERLKEAALKCVKANICRTEMDEILGTAHENFGDDVIKEYEEWLCFQKFRDTLALRSLRHPEYIFRSIPADIDRRFLVDKIKAGIFSIARKSPLEREPYIQEIKTSFGLAISVIRDEVKNADKALREEEEESTEHKACTSKGAVFEDNGRYLAQSGRALQDISSFVIHPTLRVVVSSLDTNETVEVGETIIGDIIVGNKTYHNIHFGRDCWNSKRSFLKALSSIDMRWTGSDDNVQGLMEHISTYDVPRKRGTTNLGRIESKLGAAPMWVSPNTCIKTNSAGSDEDAVYLHSGASLPGMVKYREAPADMVTEIGKRILPEILRINTPSVVLPVLGWFYATPFKPVLHGLLKHFPILLVKGGPGAGKTSITNGLFWKLFGVSSDEAYKVGLTKFTLLKLLSCTNSVPVCIDEFKPSQMPQGERNMFFRLLRSLYGGDRDERGRPDQTISGYRLIAPVCLSGEASFQEHALLERIVMASPSKEQLDSDSNYRESFKRLMAEEDNLSLMARPYVKFSLERDIRKELKDARSHTDEILAEHDPLPDRIEDNITVMVLGLRMFTEFAKNLGVELPDIDYAAAVRAQVWSFSDKDSGVKNGLDTFIEAIGVLGIRGRIRYGREYTYQPGKLCISYDACYDAFEEHCGQGKRAVEVADKKILWTLIKENEKRRGYIEGTSRLVRFNRHDNGKRAVVIDVEKAQESLNFDPPPEINIDAL